MSLNRPQAPTIGSVSELLVMDRTTLTANLKPLERRGLIKIVIDPQDRRSRRLSLTASGKRLLAKAVPIWKRTHAEIEQQLSDAEGLRNELGAISRTSGKNGREQRLPS
jgi:DNA-binding MarR family transcriptional regulator